MTSEPMTARIVIACPACGRKLGVPWDCGKLRVSCLSCAHRFEWMLDDTAPAGGEPESPAPSPSPRADAVRAQASQAVPVVPGKKPVTAFLLLALCIGFIVWGAMDFQPFAGVIHKDFLLALAIAALFGLYFAVRMTGVGRLASGIAACVLYAGVSFAGTWLKTRDITCATGDAGCREAQETAGERHFSGRNADNTSSAELDELMEEW